MSNDRTDHPDDEYDGDDLDFHDDPTGVATRRVHGLILAIFRGDYDPDDTLGDILREHGLNVETRARDFADGGWLTRETGLAVDLDGPEGAHFDVQVQITLRARTV